MHSSAAPYEQAHHLWCLFSLLLLLLFLLFLLLCLLLAASVWVLSLQCQRSPQPTEARASTHDMHAACNQAGLTPYTARPLHLQSSSGGWLRGFWLELLVFRCLLRTLGVSIQQPAANMHARRTKLTLCHCTLGRWTHSSVVVNSLRGCDGGALERTAKLAKFTGRYQLLLLQGLSGRCAT